MTASWDSCSTFRHLRHNDSSQPIAAAARPVAYEQASFGINQNPNIHLTHNLSSEPDTVEAPDARKTLRSPVYAS